MKIECTVEEFKALMNKETSNAGTSDVIIETKTTLADFLPQECQFRQEKARPNRLKLE